MHIKQISFSKEWSQNKVQISVRSAPSVWNIFPRASYVMQGSSTFQIVRATLTISMMPAGHKAMTYMCTHNWEKWPERQSDHEPLYNVQTTSGASICSYFFKTAGEPRQWGHALKTPDVMKYSTTGKIHYSVFYLCNEHISRQNTSATGPLLCGTVRNPLM
jgi:hypothetical protein